MYCVPMITSHPYPLPYDLYFNIQTIVPTLWYITFYLYFSMTPMNNNKLLIIFYWVMMITTGELFQFFILYASHQIQTKNCKKNYFSWRIVMEKIKIMFWHSSSNTPNGTTAIICCLMTSSLIDLWYVKPYIAINHWTTSLCTSDALDFTINTFHGSASASRSLAPFPFPQFPTRSCHRTKNK